MFVLGDFEVGDTIYFPFDTYDSNGASVTISGLAVTDIEVYKDGSTTQRASDNGYALLDTDGIDFDGTVGLHGFSIDTSDNSDAGFWAAGSQYWVNINAITVDGQTVRFTYYLTLGRLAKPTTAGRSIDVTATGAVGIDWGNIENPTTTVGLTGTTTAWNSAWDAEVESEANDALVALGLDHFISTSVTGADVANNSIAARLASSSATADWDTYVNTTDSLQAIRDHVGDGTNLTEAGGTGDHLTTVPWNSAWDAEAQSECNDALVANHLDHLLAVDYDPASKPGTATALLNELVESDAGVSRFTANALENVWLITIDEPAGVFAWSGTYADMFTWIGTFHRNKMTQTATTLTIRNDADSADLATGSVSDDGTTFTRGELS